MGNQTMLDSPRILIFNDTRDRPNWGSNACAETLIEILETQVPNAQIKTLTAGWIFREIRRKPRWLGKGLYIVNGSKPWYQKYSLPFSYLPNVVDEFDLIADRWLAGRGGPNADEYIELLKSSDAVVFNAEGSTYRKNHAAVLGLFMLWFAKTYCKVPAFFLNGTVALTDVDRILPGMARKAFRVLDGIAVREPYSLRNAQQYVPGVAVKMVPDSVFFTRPEQMRETENVKQLKKELGGQPYFVVSSSMLPIEFGARPAASSIVAVVHALQKVVPRAVFAAKDAGDQWLSRVAKATGGLFFGPEFDHYELMALLNDAQFILSGRYHNIILATIMGCPSIPLISASPKVDGLCELLERKIGTPYDVTDLRSNTMEIVNQAKGYVTAGGVLRLELRQLAERNRAATLELGDIVRRVLDTTLTEQGRRSTTG
jgi:hypothetical protein